MLRPLSVRWLVPFALVVLVLPACSDSGDDAADTTLAPTTTPAEAMVVLPGPGEPCDLLFFGQEDVFTRQLPEEYSALASDELGVDV